MEILDAILETYRASVPVANITTGKSFIVNIIKYGIPIILYERLPYGYYHWPVAYLLFLYMTIEPLLDTSILNLIASKKTLQIKGCECPEKQIIRGNLSSPIYYLGHIVFLNLLYCIPILGGPIYWILYPVLYGFGILEFFLAKMCTFHKYKYFTQIMPFCFGIGVCIHGLAMITCFVLRLNNPFFYIAILNIINTQVIMNGRFCPKSIKVLPNPFVLSRAATSQLIKYGSDKIIEKIEMKEIEVSEILIWLNSIKWILGDDFKDIKSFCSRDVCKYLILEHEPKIKSTLDTLIQVAQQTNVIWIVDLLGGIAPDYIISEKTRFVLKILQKEGMIDNLIEFRSMFEDVCNESSATIFADIDIIENHFRGMSRSPSVEFSEDDEWMVLKYPKAEHSS